MESNVGFEAEASGAVGAPPSKLLVLSPNRAVSPSFALAHTRGLLQDGDVIEGNARWQLVRWCCKWPREAGERRDCILSVLTFCCFRGTIVGGEDLIGRQRKK